uniref:Uncharacterized protein n=1 Tax=Arundo donax TaxID=35708 RepID=A0A0A9BBH3_ARUDO
MMPTASVPHGLSDDRTTVSSSQCRP